MYHHTVLRNSHICIFFFQLKDNCFTEFCFLLPHINMNQPSDQIRSVSQSCLTLCDPMNCSTPGLPVHHHLPEFTQTQVHHVPFSSCPQSLPALESFPMSQLFVDTFDKEVFWHNPVVSLWPKYWTFSFSIIPSKEIPGLISFRMDWVDLLQSKGLSRVFSNTTVQKHQFFGSRLSSQSNFHIHTWSLEKS